MTEGPTKRRASFADTMSAPVYTDAPLPPYTFSLDNICWLTVTIDQGRIAPFLPEGLRLGPDGTAHLALFDIGIGWGLQRTSASFPCVVIEDYPSPDTAEACWIPTGVMHGPPCELMRRHYAEFVQGRNDVRREGNLLWITVWSETTPILKVHGRILDEEPSSGSSIDRYIGRDAGGKLASSMVSVAAEGALPLKVLSLEILPDAGPIWQAFTPLSIDWAAFTPVILANWSEPSPIYPDEDNPTSRALREALLALLNGQGRACAILNRDGTRVHQNQRAHGLLPNGPRPEVFSGRTEWRRFQDSVARLALGQGGALPLQFAAARRDHGTPVILQLAPVDPALCGPGHVLLLMIDPEAGLERPITGVLQLLGLTPAEARVAATVGRGLAPRAAAEMLGIAESTIRSTLKVVFDKLHLRRQADLTALVARLMMG